MKRSVAQNTRSSFHFQEGLGVRLVSNRQYLLPTFVVYLPPSILVYRFISSSPISAFTTNPSRLPFLFRHTITHHVPHLPIITHSGTKKLSRRKKKRRSSFGGTTVQQLCCSVWWTSVTILYTPLYPCFCGNSWVLYSIY